MKRSLIVLPNNGSICGPEFGGATEGVFGVLDFGSPMGLMFSDAAKTHWAMVEAEGWQPNWLSSILHVFTILGGCRWRLG